MLIKAVFLAGCSAFICIAQTSNFSDSTFEDIVVTGVKTGIKRTNLTENTIIVDSTDIGISKAANTISTDDIRRNIDCLDGYEPYKSSL